MVQVSHDYSDLNVDGFAYPPEGFYTLKVAGEGGDNKPADKGGYFFITLTFEIVGTASAGMQFKMDYLTGHGKEITSRISKENLGRIYYGATGNRPPAQGFDTADLLGKTLQANLVIEEKPKSDGNGTFKNAKLNSIAPVAAGQQPATQQPQGNAPAPWGAK